MQYLEIPVATLFGWLIFRDLPNGLAALGIAVTVAAGLYVIWREQAIARPRPAARDNRAKRRARRISSIPGPSASKVTGPFARFEVPIRSPTARDSPPSATPARARRPALATSETGSPPHRVQARPRSGAGRAGSASPPPPRCSAGRGAPRGCAAPPAHDRPAPRDTDRKQERRGHMAESLVEIRGHLFLDPVQHIGKGCPCCTTDAVHIADHSDRTPPCRQNRVGATVYRHQRRGMAQTEVEVAPPQPAPPTSVDPPGARTIGRICHISCMIWKPCHEKVHENIPRVTRYRSGLRRTLW